MSFRRQYGVVVVELFAIPEQRLIEFARQLQFGLERHSIEGVAVAGHRVTLDDPAHQHARGLYCDGVDLLGDSRLAREKRQTLVVKLSERDQLQRLSAAGGSGFASNREPLTLQEIGVATAVLDDVKNDGLLTKTSPLYRVTPGECEAMVKAAFSANGLPEPAVAFSMERDRQMRVSFTKFPRQAPTAITVTVEAHLLAELSPVELRAMVAHEVMHVVRSRPSLYVHTSYLISKVPGSRSKLVMPARQLVENVYSRHREYDADRRGAEFTGNPQAAIRTFGFGIDPATWSERVRWFLKSDHPTEKQRIARLEKYAAELRAAKPRIAMSDLQRRGPSQRSGIE